MKAGITPEQEILTRHFCYFGPLPEGLLEHVNDEYWKDAFRGASELGELEVKEMPLKRYDLWGQQNGPEARDMISGMTKLDPKDRSTIDQVLDKQFWQSDT